MSYQVIARKWRPQTFQEVVGQSHITQTLGNALKNNRIPHAILLTGPRGTGKTTSARILAKALRCPNAVNFVPCNKCDSCIEISQGTSVDVLEIDGASNNGVDSIRELRDTVTYQPSTGKYKIYIIDEVHMLSTSAFNALLKTLEEPPPHVIFIMATTDVHKIPATILSRCQRFDFRRIPTRQIADHLAQICKEEKFHADPEALWLIARHGDGSMRDALSLLDQVISFSQGDLSRKNVSEILGLSDRELILELVETLIHHDRSRLVGLLEKFYYSGQEPRIVAQEILEMLRHLLMTKLAVSRAGELIDLPETELQILAKWAQTVSEEDLHMLFDMALKGLQDIQRGSDPQMVLEVVLLRMVAAPTLGELKQILSGQAVMHSSTKPVSPSETEKKKSLPAKEAKPTLEGWVEFVSSIKDENAKLGALLEQLVYENMEGKTYLLAVPPHLTFLKEQFEDSATTQEIQQIIDSLWGKGYALKIRTLKSLNKPGTRTDAGKIQTGESAISFQQKQRAQAEADLKTKLKQQPQIKKAMDVFGLEIKNVRDGKGS